MNNDKNEIEEREFVYIFQAPDEITAEALKSLLEGDGIPVYLESRMVPWYDGVMKMGEGFWGFVKVPKEFKERSLELIEAYRTNG